MIELFLIVLALIACNAFFALSEMSVVTSRKPRLKQMAAERRSARKALELAEHPERFLSTVQVGITSIGIVTGMLVGDALGLMIEACWPPGCPCWAVTRTPRARCWRSA